MGRRDVAQVGWTVPVSIPINPYCKSTSEPGEAVSAPPFRSDSVVDYE
jgi:hypothetical protein